MTDAKGYTTIAAIMPTYNQAKYLLEALRSGLPQTDMIVVVDDASTDGTQGVIDSFCESILNFSHVSEHTGKKLFTERHERNLGTAAAINTGFALVPEIYDWVTWWSSDNRILPGWRDAILGTLDFDPDAGAIYTGFSRCDENLTNCRTIHPQAPGNLLSTENCYYGPSFAIRRDVWAATGGHRGKISHDYDHWTRVEETCARMGLRIVGVPGAYVDYRVHPERVTNTRRHEYDAPHWRSEAMKRRGLV